MIRLALVGCDETGAGYLRSEPRLRGAAFSVVADLGADRALLPSSADSLAVATNVEQLFRDHVQAFDAVVIRSSGADRDHAFSLATTHGKHILADMPIGSSVEAIDSLIQDCGSRDVCLMASRSLRFAPSAMAIKQSLAAKQLGIPGLVRIHRWQPHVKTDENNALKRIAHFSASAIDLAIWLFQALPISVYSVTGTLKGETFDYVQLHLGFPDGGMALMDISNALPAGDAYLSMSLIGSQGAAYADDHHNKQLLFRGREPAALHTAEGVDDRLLAELQEFIDAISEQREPTVRGDDARAVLTVCQAAVQSIEAGRAIRTNAGETP